MAVKNKKTRRYWSGWFKSAPRPLMQWVSVGLIPYMAVTEGVSEGKFAMLLAFAGAIYGLREIGRTMRVNATGYDVPVEREYDPNMRDPFASNANNPDIDRVKGLSRGDF